MFPKVGRFLVRKRMAGIFIPFGEGLKPGLYDIEDCMGTLMIKRIGDPNMSPERVAGLDLDELFFQRQNSMMTDKEHKSIRKSQFENREPTPEPESDSTPFIS